jgi:hypothetical protein
VTIDALKETIRVDRVTPVATLAHTVDSTNWDGDANDPNGDGYTYGSITRDEITFDFDANEIENTNTNTNTEEEQENEN